MKSRQQIKAKRRQKGDGYKYDAAFKKKVARYHVESDLSLTRVGELFNVSHQNVSTWTHEFSSELARELNIPAMTEQEQKDVAALKQQIEALQKKLEYEQMRNFALETLADLAKTELGIDIRKNFGAKQPKE